MDLQRGCIVTDALDGITKRGAIARMFDVSQEMVKLVSKAVLVEMEDKHGATDALEDSDPARVAEIREGWEYQSEYVQVVLGRLEKLRGVRLSRAKRLEIFDPGEVSNAKLDYVESVNYARSFQARADRFLSGPEDVEVKSEGEEE